METKLVLSDIVLFILCLFKKRYKKNTFEANYTKIHAFFCGLLGEFPVLQKYLSSSPYQYPSPWSRRLESAFHILEVSRVIIQPNPWTSVYKINKSLRQVRGRMGLLSPEERSQLETIAGKFALELGCVNTTRGDRSQLRGRARLPRK